MAGRIDWRSVKARAAHQVEQYRIHAEKGGSCLFAGVGNLNRQRDVYEIIRLIVNF